MLQQARTTGAMIAIALAAFTLAGCAGGTEAPTTTAPMTESPMTDEPMTDEPAAEPTAEPTEEPAADAPGAYVDYTDDVIATTAGRKVLFFHASWCPQCRTLDEELRTQGVPDGLTVIKVDYDSMTELRQRYGVTLQTTVVYVDDAGEMLSSAVIYDEPSVASLVAAGP
ncbi:thioredoxin [Agromyces albus]|uniref:thioredoxin n=1 Tax=Agromyces albus TaxID=205332 RepID=UPI002787680F|nr:thioredoxin family protein [Agromyces albus]MDQ0577506.1 thiol-disulfide isomerase/thioredoxin [Agromyces albus]